MRRPIDTSPRSTRATGSVVTIPSLARARELGLTANEQGWFGRTKNLLLSEPQEASPAIALVVRALIQTRASFDREDELGVGLVQKLLATGAHKPTRRLEPSSWQGIVAVLDRAPRLCSACTYTPGKGSCAGCGGSGRIPVRSDNDNEERSCPACNGRGLVVCSCCDGSTRVQRATVRTWEDRVAELEHVFLPRMALLLHEAVSEHLLALDEMAPEHRVDLDRPDTESIGSYRSGTRSGPPHFHGIEASGVLSQAKETLQRLGAASAIERAIEAHAVPMLLLRYPSSEVALVSPGAGEMVALVGAAG